MLKLKLILWFLFNIVLGYTLKIIIPNFWMSVGLSVMISITILVLIQDWFFEK